MCDLNERKIHHNWHPCSYNKTVTNDVNYFYNHKDSYYFSITILSLATVKQEICFADLSLWQYQQLQYLYRHIDQSQL